MSGSPADAAPSTDPSPPSSTSTVPPPSPRPLPRPTSGTLGSLGTHQRRIFARIVDLLVFVALANVAEPLGPALGLLYVLAGDACWRGQSVGKRMFRVKVVRRADGSAPHLLHSVGRNLPVAVGLVMWLIPVLGWVLLPILGAPVLLLELRFCRAGERGRRMGDILAETYVADAWDPA